MKFSKLRKASQGVSLTEYALIGATVLVASIAGFLYVGGGLNDVFANLKADLFKTKSDAQAAVLMANAAKASEPPPKAPVVTPPPVVTTPAPTTPTPPPTSSGTGGFPPIGISGVNCTGNLCVKAPDLAGSTLVLGANGSRMAQAAVNAAGVLAQIAKIIEADPEGDPALVDLLTRMALNGHEIGDSQSTILLKSSNFDKNYDAMWTLDNSLSTFNSLSKQLQPYLALMPASTKDLILNASKVITTTGGSYDLSYSSNSFYWSANYVSSIKLTHTSSNTICTNGGAPPLCIR